VCRIWPLSSFPCIFRPTSSKTSFSSRTPPHARRDSGGPPNIRIVSRGGRFSSRLPHPPLAAWYENLAYLRIPPRQDSSRIVGSRSGPDRRVISRLGRLRIFMDEAYLAARHFDPVGPPRSFWPSPFVEMGWLFASPIFFPPDRARPMRRPSIKNRDFLPRRPRSVHFVPLLGPTRSSHGMGPALVAGPHVLPLLAPQRRLVARYVSGAVFTAVLRRSYAPGP